MATGRSVAEVGRDALALNLWTWWEVRQIEEEARVQRLGERVDAAAMTALAFHEPKKLATQERRYLKEAGLLGQMLDAAKARALETVAAAKKAGRVVRVVKPGSVPGSVPGTVARRAGR